MYNSYMSFKKSLDYFDICDIIKLLRGGTYE